MASIKEKIIKDTGLINDEGLLNQVYLLLNDIQDTRKMIELNEEQKQTSKRLGKITKQEGINQKGSFWRSN